MAKPNRTPQPQSPARVCRIVASDMFYQTLKNFSDNATVLKALKAFIEQKRAQPLAPFGAKDYPFKGNGPLQGVGHAGLTFDASIVYTISGKNPNVITLYGIFTHDQLGTGQPANIKRQKQAAGSIHNQVNFTPYDKVDESAVARRR